MFDSDNLFDPNNPAQVRKEIKEQVNEVIEFLVEYDLLEGADLQKVDLEGADLEEAYFGESNLHCAMFENADLSGATFWGANLTNANFRGANFRGVCLTPKQLSEIIVVDE